MKTYIIVTCLNIARLCYNFIFVCSNIIHWTIKLGIITFSICFSGILNLTVHFYTSAYVAIIWQSFDINLTVLSKSQMELRSVKYGNTPPPPTRAPPPPPPPQKNEVYRSMEDDQPTLKFRQFLSMAVTFYGYILGKMLYFQ